MKKCFYGSFVMADIAGVSFSIAQPIVNSGVNQLREPENKEAAEELRATSAPQRNQPVNDEPADVSAEQSVSSRLDFSVPTTENTTEENTTVINEQVVAAAGQQIQQASIEANANRPAETNQSTSQASQQNTNAEETVQAANPPVEQEQTTNPTPVETQTQPLESSQVTQSSQSQATSEQFESGNPEAGLGLDSGSIINVTA